MTKPNALPIRAAVAVLTENGTNPLSKDELFAKLPTLTGRPTPKYLAGAFKSFSITRHSDGRFSAVHPAFNKLKEAAAESVNILAQNLETPPPEMNANGNGNGAHKYACEKCGRADFPSKMSMAAHHRWCGKSARARKLQRQKPAHAIMVATQHAQPVHPFNDAAAEVINIVQNFSDLMTAFRLVRNKRAAMGQ